MKKAINVLCRISYILDLVLSITSLVMTVYFLAILLVGLSYEPAEFTAFVLIFGGIVALFAFLAIMGFVSRYVIKNIILPRYRAAKWKDVVKNPAIWAIVVGALSVDTLLVAGILMLAMPENQLPANSNNQ